MGSALDAAVSAALQELLKAGADALQTGCQRDQSRASDALATRVKDADEALGAQFADPRKMSVRGVRKIVESLLEDLAAQVRQLGEARLQQEQDLMAALAKDAVRAMQRLMTDVKEEVMSKQRKQTGDAVRKLKAAAVRQMHDRESAGVAEAAAEFREKEEGYKAQIAALTEQVEELSVRAEAAEGSVKRGMDAASSRCEQASRESEVLRRQLQAMDDRHRSERSRRLGLEKAAADRAAEFWRRSPINAQAKPKRSVAQMRQEEEALREKVRLAEAYSERARLEELKAVERRKQQEAEAAEMAKKLAREAEAAEGRKRLEEERAAAAAAERQALLELAAAAESQRTATERLVPSEGSDHRASALRKETAALRHEGEAWAGQNRLPLSPSKSVPQGDESDEDADGSPRISVRVTSPTAAAGGAGAAGSGRAAVTSLRPPALDDDEPGEGEEVTDKRMMTMTKRSRVRNVSSAVSSQLVGGDGASWVMFDSAGGGDGAFENCLAELSYSASMAELRQARPESAGALVDRNPNTVAVAVNGKPTRPHSAAAGSLARGDRASSGGRARASTAGSRKAADVNLLVAGHGRIWDGSASTGSLSRSSTPTWASSAKPTTAERRRRPASSMGSRRRGGQGAGRSAVRGSAAVRRADALARHRTTVAS